MINGHFPVLLLICAFFLFVLIVLFVNKTHVYHLHYSDVIPHEEHEFVFEVHLKYIGTNTHHVDIVLKSSSTDTTYCAACTSYHVI